MRVVEMDIHRRRSRGLDLVAEDVIRPISQELKPARDLFAK
jgi:hypothetical protein